VGRLPLQWVVANGKAPTLLPASEELLFNVEGLNDARTKHGKRRVSARRGRAGEKSDFFSILLACPLPSLLRLAGVCNLFPSRNDLMDEAVDWQH